MELFNSIARLIPTNVLITFIIVVIILWLVFREARTWYWKINDVIRILNRIDEKLDFIVESDAITNVFIPESKTEEKIMGYKNDSYFNETKVENAKEAIEENQDSNGIPLEEEEDKLETRDISILSTTSKIKELLNKKIF